MANCLKSHLKYSVWSLELSLCMLLSYPVSYLRVVSMILLCISNLHKEILNKLLKYDTTLQLANKIQINNWIWNIEFTHELRIPWIWRIKVLNRSINPSNIHIGLIFIHKLYVKQCNNFDSSTRSCIFIISLRKHFHIPMNVAIPFRTNQTFLNLSLTSLLT